MYNDRSTLYFQFIRITYVLLILSFLPLSLSFFRLDCQVEPRPSNAAASVPQCRIYDPAFGLGKAPLHIKRPFDKSEAVQGRLLARYSYHVKSSSQRIESDGTSCILQQIDLLARFFPFEEGLLAMVLDCANEDVERAGKWFCESQRNQCM